MVKMVGTGAHRAKYRTRRLLAGDEVEMGSRDARLYRALGWAEDAPVKRRGRPPKQPDPVPAPAAAVPSSTTSDDLEDKTNAELLVMARERGLELPEGYVKNETLIELLRA